MREDPKPYEIYRHFKGKLYQIIALAVHSETRECLVVYQALYGSFDIYARPLSMFMSKVDEEKYPEYEDEYRFQRIEIQEQKKKYSDLSDESLYGNIEPTEKGKSESCDIHKKKQRIDSSTASETILVESDNKEIKVDESEERAIRPELLQFLEAKGYEEKLSVLLLIKGKLDQEMINSIAMSLDVEIPKGDISDRYEALKTCLLTKEKYECSRRLV